VKFAGQPPAKRTGGTSAISRRELLAGFCAATVAGSCRSRHEGVVRIGFMTNLTHAPAMVGVGSGRIGRALGVPLESRSFRAGPRVVEALMGDAIDVGVTGPAAIVYTHARHPGALRILSGCSSGGASFVVGRASGIAGPGDLRGKVLATPQIGTTQDIALRKYLRTHGYEPAERGGDVTVHALDAATIFAEIKKAALDGAWLPEPWATRVVLDTGAVRLVDERELWPERLFPTALLTARSDWVKAQPSLAARLVEAIGDEVDRALRLPDETCTDAQTELQRLLGKKLPLSLLHEASRWIDFTRDPLPAQLETLAGDAFALGLAPRTSCATLFG
jgi:NitT/TauT family transport system substrate-binding protein